MDTQAEDFAEGLLQAGIPVEEVAETVAVDEVVDNVEVVEEDDSMLE